MIQAARALRRGVSSFKGLWEERRAMKVWSPRRLTMTRPRRASGESSAGGETVREIDGDSIARMNDSEDSEHVRAQEHAAGGDACAGESRQDHWSESAAQRTDCDADADKGDRRQE